MRETILFKWGRSLVESNVGSSMVSSRTNRTDSMCQDRDGCDPSWGGWMIASDWSRGKEKGEKEKETRMDGWMDGWEGMARMHPSGCSPKMRQEERVKGKGGVSIIVGRVT